MTRWLLECTVCSERRVIDVGFDLSEFEQLHIFCRRCGYTRPHRVLGVIDPKANQS